MSDAVLYTRINQELKTAIDNTAGDTGLSRAAVVETILNLHFGVTTKRQRALLAVVEAAIAGRKKRGAARKAAPR